jgi:4-hydroxybenzoyl-CoA thioesterase
MIRHDRPVRFEDIDAAGILFFARFLNYCHDAMERLFDGLPGGYVDLITRRRIGFPAVHVDAEFHAPLRFGDVAHIETSVTKVGTSSCTFRYVLTRGRDGLHVATIRHVTVSTDLDAVKKVPLPPDVRALLESHLEPGT